MYLVFDIGGTFVKYAMMDKEANVHEKGKIPTIKKGLAPFLDSLEEIYYQFKDVDGIALSCPGLIDVDEGVIYHGGALKFLHECHIVKELSKRCQNVQVSVENDGKCAGLAESSIGAAKDYQDAIIMAFGTGVGGAIIKDKKVHRGTRLIAGELSFITTAYNRKDLSRNTWGERGNAIHLALDLDKAKGKEKGTYSGEDVFAMAEAGDEDATNILEDFYYDVANQINNMQYIYDPDIFCIGGGISEQPALLEGINRYVDKLQEISFQMVKPKVVKCQFQNDSNLIGALFNYLQMYE
ncbi:MAG: ROK family protein [Coprobacillaceae bacterium]